MSRATRRAAGTESGTEKLPKQWVKTKRSEEWTPEISEG
jgi:hypothetical protein